MRLPSSGGPRRGEIGDLCLPMISAKLSSGPCRGHAGLGASPLTDSRRTIRSGHLASGSVSRPRDMSQPSVETGRDHAETEMAQP